MPLVTVQTYIKSLLNGLIVPGPAGIGPLEAFIQPPDPNDDTIRPAAYIWASGGREVRQSMPRNTGPGTPAGWKDVYPDVEIYLVWFDSDEDPYADTAFHSVIDAVMQVLRTSPDPAQVVDPNSGLVCELAGVGEHMTWQALSVTSTADQRWLRFDALLLVPYIEFIQA